MDFIRQYWPFLLPILLLQIGLAVLALADILRRDTYKAGSRKLWIPVVLLGQLWGPVAYFVFGRPSDG